MKAIQVKLHAWLSILAVEYFILEYKIATGETGKNPQIHVWNT